MKIYHNPRCSKSRAALLFIRKRGIEPEIVLYLENPPTKYELNKILSRFDGDPYDILRKEESIYKEKYKDKDLSKDSMVDAIVNDPILLERPIVVTDDAAVVGRPVENLEKFF